MKKLWKIALPVAAVMILATGCSQQEGGKYNQQDSGRTGIINKTAADLIDMPDGFSNVATKCDHGNRIYVMFHGDSPSGSIFVVPNAPGCAQ